MGNAVAVAVRHVCDGVGERGKPQVVRMAKAGSALGHEGRSMGAIGGSEKVVSRVNVGRSQWVIRPINAEGQVR